MTRLLFVERPLDAALAAEQDADTVVVAVTGAALDALERAGVPFEPLASFTAELDLMALEPDFNVAALRLATELEEHIARRAPEAPVGAEGLLRGQRYYLQYSIGAIVCRSLLMRAAIEALRPERVAVVGAAVDPWFGGSGYDADPWLTVLRSLEGPLGFRLEILDGGAEDADRRSAEGVSDRTVLRRTVRAAAGRAAARLRGLTSGRDRSGLRILGVGADYDWAPVYPRVGARVWKLDLLAGPYDWRTRFAPRLRLPDARTVELPAAAPNTPGYGALVDDWLAAEPRRLEVAGLDVLPALTPELRALADSGAELCRHSDLVAAAVLDRVRPDVVTCFSIPWLALGRLTALCRERGVPVLCYQHGGSFGTHVCVQHELTEFSRADVFLSYGEGIRPTTRLLGLPQARFVPVGSTRIERRHRRRAGPAAPERRPLSVLWLGTLPTRNVLPVWFYGEETTHCLLERECLDVLAASPLVRVRYRPFPGTEAEDGVALWASRVHPDRIELERGIPMEQALEASDVVVTAITSGTAWNEVLGMEKPLVLYCDDRITPLVPEFDRDLDRACHRVHTADEFREAVRRLAAEGAAFVVEARRDPTEFLLRYVLHRDDGNAAGRAAAVIEDAVRAGAAAAAAPRRSAARGG